MMNSKQIERILKNIKVTRKYFLGVFASNNIPKHKSYPYCFIANTGKLGTSGEHWVACFVENSKKIEYFDSLGEKPNKDLRDFLDKLKQVQINKIPLQSSFSDACGHYCIYFLVCRCSKIPYCQVMDILYKTRAISDYLVKGFVRLILRV